MADMTLMIVDDSEDDREVIRRALRHLPRLNCDVIEADDGQSCLDHLENGAEPNCILLDYSLPGEDGLRVLERIVGHFRDIPVVMITGQGDENIAVRALKAGAQDYLVKTNITTESLSRALGNAIERADMARKIRDQHDTLSQFARLLAHDLKAPLRAISGFLEILEDDLKDRLDDGNVETIDVIRTSAHRMDRLIHSLSVYSTAESQTLDTQRINLGAVLQDLLSTVLRADLDAAGARVTVGDLPDINGDEAQIYQLFQNLIGNGIKYNRSDTPTLHISQGPPGIDRITISLRDNGIGIAPEYLDQIFEPLKRLHNEREFEGTGLGLATCKSIVERHGGKIWCVSDLGRGTEFLITFPRPAPIRNQQRGNEAVGEFRLRASNG